MAAASACKRCRDHSSFANCDDVKVLHTDFDLHISFERRSIAGVATVRVEAVGAGGASVLVLDTRDLSIQSVKRDGAAAAFELQAGHEVLGAALAVTLDPPLAQGQSATLAIDYATSTESSALQWLDPESTAGKRHPYMFSQCQAIHCRSMAPCQDTPLVKMTYTARVTVPMALTALMSAVVENDGKPIEEQESTRTFGFTQNVPIPAYLLAIAAGELESRDIGPRSRVWSEPSMVGAGQYEFSNTEDFLKAAEDIAGPYIWGRYDILLLPPFFAYGGMENPCLTFATPTLLAGDRSLTTVIAHEVAHSWTGNFVTNATWEHFWLNEGCNVFLERKIIERLLGTDVSNLYATQGKGEMLRTIARIGEEHNYTKLCPDLSGGGDPDDAFSCLPYEKGFYFNVYLERLAGGPDKYVPWFREQWISGHRDASVDSQEFQRCYCEAFPEAGSKVDWQAWFSKPGFPIEEIAYDDPLGAQARNLAAAWHAAGDTGEFGSPADIEGWKSVVLELFLDEVMGKPLPLQTCRRLGEVYALKSSRNSELRFRWLQIALAAKNPEAPQATAAFVSEQGRMKFVRPLYRALFGADIDGAKDLATETFTRNRNAYAPVARKMLEADLGFRASTGPSMM